MPAPVPHWIKDNHKDIAKLIEKLSHKRVLVGIPMENDPRDDAPIGNASIGYINEFGSPAVGIPPRPHLVPGVEASLPQVKRKLEAALKSVVSGSSQFSVDAYLGQAGQLAVNSVKRTIRAGLQPNLSPYTVLHRTTGRARRTKEAGKRGISLMQQAVEEASSGNLKPLIDTSNYINSIVWVLDEKK